MTDTRKAPESAREFAEQVLNHSDDPVLRRAARAFLANISASSPAPAETGWRLVPVEPTECNGGGQGRHRPTLTFRWFL